MNHNRRCSDCGVRYAQEDGKCRQCAAVRIGDATRVTDWPRQTSEPRERQPAPKKTPLTSWWANHAQPNQRAHFIEAAQVRNLERTKAEDIRQGHANQMMKHIIAPKAYPPSNRHRSVK